MDGSQRTVAFGGSSSLAVDASPLKRAFLRFRVATGGRDIVSARLRLKQTDSSNVGGRVSAVSATSWTESMTWDTQPAIDGERLGSFGLVQFGALYSLDVGAAITGDGRVSMAIDSTSSDGAQWASRETSTPPELVVEVERPADVVFDGLSQVASPLRGSSDPTYYGGNRRMAVTAAGRLFALHGRHSTGLQLAWRDPGGGWQTRTTGATPDGLLLSGSGTGDWPASIAVARDAEGTEHAWVVWSGSGPSSLRPVRMLRLTGLDAATGPTVGSTMTVDAPSLGAYRPDIAFERGPDGAMHGCIVWSRRASETSYELVTTWFTDLAAETPALHDERVIYETTSSSTRYASLLPTPGGMRVAARASSGNLRLYAHDAAASLATWSRKASGAYVSSSGSPTGTGLGSGEALVAFDSDSSAGIVRVQRFSASGSTATVDLELRGYRQPSISSDGTDATLVMVRLSDGYVVSRRFVPGSGWTATDRVEIGSGGGGNHAWPNLLRDNAGSLRFLVRGPKSSSTRSSVLSFQRAL